MQRQSIIQFLNKSVERKKEIETKILKQIHENLYLMCWGCHIQIFYPWCDDIFFLILDVIRWFTYIYVQLVICILYLVYGWARERLERPKKWSG